MDTTILQALNKIIVYYRPQTKFAKVMFSQVSVCPQGGVCPVASGQTLPGRHPLGRHPPSFPVHAGIHPPHSACWDTVNKRAVRIPLECILVFHEIF